MNFQQKIYLPILFTLFSFLSQISYSQTVSIGQFSFGKTSIKLDLSDFEVIKKHADITVHFIEDSLQWIRPDTNLLTPRILLQIKVPVKYKPIYLKYQNHTIFPSEENDYFVTEIYVNLYHPEPIEIYQDTILIDKMSISAKTISNSDKQWIDGSCQTHKVKITGLENEYSSVGCKLHRVGQLGHERPRLEVSLSSPNFATPTGEEPPYLFNLNNNSPVNTVLIHKKSNTKNSVSISADLPDRLYRLKTALGFGPYSLTSRKGDNKLGPTIESSLMLYGKYDLNENSSFKAFDAIIPYDTFFNNSGLYYSYDIAKLFDGELIFGALIGFQGLHYRHDRHSDMEFGVIFPQGLEITYNNAFGLKNKYLSYGMFLSTTRETYRNIWLRFGDRIFYELNYITWGKEQSAIEMAGISIGVPFFKAY